jgi:TonB family protein
MRLGKVRASEQREPRDSSSAVLSATVSRIGKYEVVTQLGAFKRARVKVFRAFDRDIGRPITLKLVTDASDPWLADEFRHEVSSVAKLRVPNVIAIYEMGEYAGLPFAAMQDLGDDHVGLAIEDKRSLTLLQKMLIIEQVAAGVADAHRGGLAYVGIRPSAIALAGEGVAALQDFGVVRLTGGMPDEGGLYRSPEEAGDGFASDWVCDVFSFGILCYEFLTGFHPFRSDRRGEDGVCDWEQQPAPLRKLLPDCPESLEALVLRCLDLRREFRYQNLDDICDELRPILQGLKQRRAAELWEDSRRLIDAQRLEEAQGVVREAFQLDPDDADGRQISADLRALLQSQRTQARLEELWRQGDEAAANRRFFAAVDILKSASRLDETNQQTQSRLETVSLRLERSLEAAQLLAEARLLVENRDWEAARTRVMEALDRDPEDPEASELLRVINQTIERNQKEAQIEEAVEQAKSMVLLQAFDEALDILVQLRAESPDSEVIQQWIDHTETQKRETERQTRLQTVTRGAESLLSQQRFSETVALIESAGVEFSEDDVLSDLLLEARTALERARVLDEATTSCHQLRQQHSFDQALDVLDGALASFPVEPVLVALRRQVETEAESYKRTTAVREALDEVRWLVDQRRPDLAVRFLEQRCTDMIAEPSLAAWLAELQETLPAWQRGRFIEFIQDFSSHRGPDEEQPNDGAVWLPVLEEALKAGTLSSDVAEIATRLRKRLRGQMIIAEVRHCLAGGNADQADEILQGGLEFLSGEPLLGWLQQEIDACKTYLEARRRAQVLIGSGRLGEAEEILFRLEEPNRPEIQDLLELIAALRAASDETAFFERVREQALLLTEQGRLAEADELFRRLLTLYPADEQLAKEKAAAHAEGLTSWQLMPSLAVDAPIPPKRGGNPELEGWSALEEPPSALLEPRRALRSWSTVVWKAAHRVSSNPVRTTLTLVSVLFLLAVAGAIWRSWRSPVSIPAAPTMPVGERNRVTAANPQSLLEATPLGSAALNRAAASDHKAGAARSADRNAAGPEPALREEQAPVRAFTAPAKPTGADSVPTASLPAPPNVASADLAPERPGTLPIGQGLANVTPPAPPKAASGAASEAPSAPRRGAVVPPKLISGPPPELPMLAKLNGVQGTVEVEAMVDKEGHITAAKAIRGNTLLTEAAQDAVLQWRYQPAAIDGQPVDAKVEITVHFRGAQ